MILKTHIESFKLKQMLLTSLYIKRGKKEKAILFVCVAINSQKPNNKTRTSQLTGAHQEVYHHAEDRLPHFFLVDLTKRSKKMHAGSVSNGKIACSRLERRQLAEIL